MSGFGQTDPVRKQAGVQESSGPLLANASKLIRTGCKSDPACLLGLLRECSLRCLANLERFGKLSSFLNGWTFTSRTCFGQCDKLLQATKICSRSKTLHLSIYFNHPSQANSTNYYMMVIIILGPTDNAAPPTSQQTDQFPPKRVKHWHCHPFFFLFFLVLSSSSTGELSLLLPTKQRQGLPNWMNSSQTMLSEAFWIPNTSSLLFVELPKADLWSKSFPVKNEKSLPIIFFRFAKHPELGLQSKKIIQLWMHLTSHCMENSLQFTVTLEHQWRGTKTPWKHPSPLATSTTVSGQYKQLNREVWWHPVH